MLALHLNLFFAAVGFQIFRHVAGQAIGDAFNKGGAFTGAGACGGLADGLINGFDIIAVDLHTFHAISTRKHINISYG